MANPTPVAVTRNETPLVLLSVDPDAPLADVRAQLRQRGLILDSDRFVDPKEFPVPADKEGEWKLSELLARAEEKTLRVKSTEREAKKSLFSRLAEAAAKETPPEIPTGPELPKDKGATVLEGDTKAREIETPVGHVTLGSDALGDPVLLDKEAWRNIVERNNLLRGIRIDENPPMPAFKPAFDIIGGIPRFVVQDTAFVSATVTHSESVHAMVMNKFSKVEASASYCFVSASFERTSRESSATTESAARTYVIGEWNLPRVVLQLRPEDLAPDPALTAAVEAIVTPPGDPELKYFALRRLFREYGQVWATEVTLGGQLTVTDTVTITDRKEEKSVESAMKLAVSAKIGSFKAGVGGAVGGDTTDKSAQFAQFKDKRFQATGGDTRLAQEPGSWVSTIGPAANWRVIARRGLLPLYMVLAPELRRKVRDLLAGIDARYMPELFETGAPPDLAWRDAVRAEKDGFLVAQLVGCPPGRSEVWGAASAPSGLPGDPVLRTTLWGPPGPSASEAARIAAASRSVLSVAIGAAIAAQATTPTDRVEFQTLTLPVRRRDTMMIEPIESGPGAVAGAARIHWYEMAYFDQAYFGPTEAPSTVAGDHLGLPSQSWTPGSDGFVVLAASCDPGAAGLVSVYEDGVKLMARLSLEAKAAGLSQGSLCMPVRKAHPYTIAMTKGGDGKPFAGLRLRFVPINDHLGALGDPIDQKPSVCCLAESDGFLFGSFSGTGKAVVHATLNSGTDREQFQKQEPIAAMSLLRSASGCLGAPIRKNNYYYLHVTGVPAAATVDRLQFFPLRRF